MTLIPSLSELPITLHPSRTRYVTLLIVSILFVLAGIFMVHAGDRSGWLVICLFGIGVVVFIITLQPGAAYLELTREGFTVCSLYRKHFTSWSGIEGFGTYRVRGMRATKMVGWNYAPGFKNKKAGALRSLNSALVGYEAAFPTTSGMKATDLAVLMNSLLEQYLLTQRLSS